MAARRRNPTSRAGCRALAAVGLLLACSGPEPPSVYAETDASADELFRGDSRWLGADGAYSVDLGGERILWMFGDTWVAQEPWQSEGAFFIRNSVAVQTGRDPRSGLIEYYWCTDAGAPRSFLPRDDDRWYWPTHGIRLDDVLLLFFEVVRRPDQCDEPEWCFEGTGWTAFVIDNPDAPPSALAPTAAILPAESYGFDVGEALFVEDEHLYAYATGGSTHSLYLARFAVAAARRGDLTTPEWWGGDDGWRERPAAGPERLVVIGAPELSVHFEPHLGQYSMVYTQGFGPSTLSLRVAEHPQGPWSSPRDIIRPPESFERSAQVYAGKAHPALRGAELWATYVPGDLYYPRFVAVSF